MKQFLQKVTLLFALLVLANVTYAHTQLLGEDVALEIVAPISSTADVGDMVTFTVRVNNEGLTALSALGVNVALPINATITGSSAASGTFNESTGVWNIGNMLATDASFDLTIDYMITSGGVMRVDAEVVSLAEVDIDSTPNNNIATEDDQANGCITIPLVIGCSTDILSLTLSAPSGYASYQWLMDNVAIPGATGVTYLVTEPGSYIYEVVDFAGCMDALCCPVTVTKEECVSIGNQVFADTGQGAGGTQDNGLIDGSEPGVANVIMYLYLDADGDGDPSNAVLVTKDTTDANGYYLFEDLIPDANYIVAVGNENFTTGGPLENYSGSTGATAGTDNTDNGVDAVDPTFGVLSGPVSVSVDGAPSGETNLGPEGNGVLIDDNNADLTVDFGFWQPMMDLALIKTLAPGQSANVAPGDVVNYVITITNQGNIPANNIQVTDYLPTGMSFDAVANPGWINTAGNIQRTLTAGVELPATGLVGSIDVAISLILDAPLAGDTNIQNFAEISGQTNLAGDVVADLDSTPDANNNDTYQIDDYTSGDGLNGGDEDDHDQATITTLNYDLALIKQLAVGQASLISPGDEVNFLITITNQGEIPADNISIIDYLPGGFTLNDTDWTDNGNNTASITLAVATGELATPLAANGGSTTVEITLTSSDPFTALTTATNIAEIASSTDDNGVTQQDIDSTPDMINDDVYTTDDFIGGNGMVGADEDDHDQATVTVDISVMDLALAKKISASTPSPIIPGEGVTFDIEITNQGSIDANSVTITDYVPVGLTLDPTSPWTSNPDGTASITLEVGDEWTTALVPGVTRTFPITFTVTAPMAFGTVITNTAEISALLDGTNTPRADVDSTPDNMDDDTYVTNNDVSGNGLNGGDEDDHDRESFTVAEFDLALVKTLATGQSPNITPGDNVTFEIQVTNQGDITAGFITITDYIPAELTLSDAAWTDNMDGTASRTLSAPAELGAAGLIPGATISIPITFTTASPLVAGSQIVNTAEISSTQDTNGNMQQDVDSTPDANNSDLYTTNDFVGGDGLNGGDEDDHDIEILTVNSFDLALTKTLAGGQVTEINPGDNVTYLITVTNQGQIAASNIDLVDYIPAGMTLNDANWATNGNGDATITLSAANITSGSVTPLAPLSSATVEVTMTLDNPYSGAMTIQNTAEVSAVTDSNGNVQSDQDSTPDDMDDDTYITDNDITGDGLNTGDEDDHDAAFINVNQFDLALAKILAVGQVSKVDPGDLVTFTIEVTNQGPETADMIVITDYIPAGMTLADANWTASGINATTMLSVANGRLSGVGLEQNETESFDIVLMVNADATATNLVNYAEISEARDLAGKVQEDVDSTPDSINDDTFLTDNDISGDGNNGGDEDDNDLASIEIEQGLFDLALIKAMAPGESNSVVPGGSVTFMITVTNQGDVAADNIVITDYIPVGLTLNDSDWSAVVANETTHTMSVANGGLVTGGLAAGTSISVEITFDVDPGLAPNTLITNTAEISAATRDDGEIRDDIDSTPDSDNTDSYITNDFIDGNGSLGGDEDDHDPEVLMVLGFDLALAKTLGTGQLANVTGGSQATFDVTVYNQFDQAADNITITDYLPTGLTLAAGSAWALNGNGDPAITLSVLGGQLPAGGLVTGAPVTVSITVDIDAALTANSELINTAEISSFTDLTGVTQQDYDSTPDDVNDDVFVTNDDLSGDANNGDDEDDSDRESLFIQPFDLALAKTTASSTVEPGDEITFDITIYNQGQVSADNIVIEEYIPAGMTLSATQAFTWIGGGASGTDAQLVLEVGDELVAPLAPGAEFTVTINLVVDSPLAAGTSLTNSAEISSATNELGVTQNDIDGTFDNTDGDTFINNDDVSGDANTGGDEDNHDQETVTIEAFDLALIKTAPATSVAPGDDVTFTVTVLNQGDIAADNIQITDYIPADMTLADADWNGVSATEANINLTSANIASGALPLLPGQSLTVEVTLNLNAPLASNVVVTNYAEISSATDDAGNPQQDVDSSPDAIQDDTYLVDDQITGDGLNGGDEDDHDQATLDVKVFDLALTKALVNPAITSFQPGADVEYIITVINQGEILADNISIKDYIPAGMSLSTNDTNNWDAAGNLTLTSATDSNLPLAAAGGTTTVNIILTIDNNIAAGTDLANFAEVSGATDNNGNPTIDVDSTPDDVNDDTFLTDNAINGNGANGEDEDDNDPSETITIQVFDLALDKQLAAGQSSDVSAGDEVVYTITVHNQGDYAADDIQLIDYIPANMSLSTTNPNGWTLDANGNAIITLNVGDELATALPDASVAPSNTFSWDIYLVLDNPLPANTTIINEAEITSGSNEFGVVQGDIDSTPNSTQGDDEYLVDNEINGNGIEGGDEDDSDIATVTTGAFDLALIKRLAVGQNSVVQPNDIVNYVIRVFNQGDVTADNITITDYIPTGMTLVDPNWTMNGGNAQIVLNSGEELPAGGLVAGAFADVNISLQLGSTMSANSKYTNEAEISSAEDENGVQQDDIDSTFDDIPGDEFVTDDYVDGDGLGGEDEDDSDQAEVLFEVFDVALRKTTSQTTPAVVGGDVEFTITVFNQGSVGVKDIEVTDFIPEGFALSANDFNGWLFAGSASQVRTMIQDVIAPGDSAQVNILLTVQPGATLANLINVAEISSQEDEFGVNQNNNDIDSSPNYDPTDDISVNDIITQDGSNGGDEDDNDFEVSPVFDLALRKTVAPNTYAKIGEDIPYEITIFNQGNMVAQNVVITDYMPTGFDLSPNATGWTDNGDGTVTGGIVGPIMPTDSSKVTIILTPNALAHTDNLRNHAEISGAENEYGADMVGFDLDSPNYDTVNDDLAVNDEIDGNGMDEDDHDYADVKLFDLAIRKWTASSTPVQWGEDVNFFITVYNQSIGGVVANNYSIVDYIPAGFILSPNDANGWASTATNLATQTLTGPLAQGDSMQVEILLQVVSGTTAGTYNNTTEITGAFDGNLTDVTNSDYDSTPNMDSTDDSLVDNEINDQGTTDEDDADIAPVVVEVVDFALIKTTDQTAPVQYGDDILYTITVYNQGSVTMQNVTVRDLVPAGMELSINDTNNWTSFGAYADNVIQGPIAPGESASVNILLTVKPNSVAGTHTNVAEIISLFDVANANRTGDDIDSQADTDLTNDNLIDDEINDGGLVFGGVNDEDDNDIAIVSIFDLALRKTTPVTTSVVAGDDVPFLIEVFNQGSIDANNVSVTDYIPAGFELSANDTNGWTSNADGSATLTGIGAIAAGSSTSVTILLTVQTSAEVGVYENEAEISYAEDAAGNDATSLDVDSDTDNEQGNDLVVDDEINDIGTNDEDDADIALVAVEVVDLALRKIVQFSNNGPVSIGDDIQFGIEVFNQGSVPLTNIQVVDYIPAGFELSPTDGNGWILNGSQATNTITDVIAPNGSKSIGIVLRVLPTATPVNLQNSAEIFSMEDEGGIVRNDDELDSTPDTTNDDIVVNDEIEDDGTIDEDDHDIADVSVFDLALRKTLLSDAIATVGDDVTFQIEVFNQGTITAQNVELIEHLPAGFELSTADTNGWAVQTNGDLTNTLTSTIAPGTSATIEIVAKVILGATPGTATNIAEILSAEDDLGNDQTGNDFDSTPDNDPTDPLVDDEISDNTGVDEDDNDIAVINIIIVDLAIRKTTSQVTEVEEGDDVIFEIAIFNQGSEPMYNIEITDFYPVGFVLSASDSNGWTDNGNGTASVIIPGPIMPGVNATTGIVLNLEELKEGGILNNVVEISGSEDVNGNDTSLDDVDSTVDLVPDPNNDNIIDNEVNDTGALDEDDHDVAGFPVSTLSLLSSLGDTVWIDSNADGLQNNNEVGLEGLSINLYDGTGMFVASTTTDMNGFYEFTMLISGDYQVQFVHGTAPDSLAVTIQNAGDDALDSDADPVTGYSQTVTLAPGEHNPTIDAGYIPLSGLGDYVWLDANNDGVQDATEAGIEDVLVTLYDGAGNFVDNTTTNGTGYYEFINLIPGDYSVVFDHNTVDDTLAPTTQVAGTDTSVDSNADVITGQTALTNLSPGEFDSTIDAGYYPLSGLGDYVWLDANNDGIQDATESGIEGVTVSLYDGFGNFISDTETNGIGYYEFINLVPGDYSVVFDHNTVDDTLAPTTQVAGTDTSVDSNADVITGQTALTNLSPGEFDETIDAGYYPLSGLGDYVWLDANNDGIQDATESGIEGVTVSLYDGFGNFISDTETNGIGYYEFINLVPGDYSVVFDHNTVDDTLAPTTQVAGTDTSVDSNADVITGQTALTNLSPGEFDSTIDAGYSPLSGLGDYVWLDANNDGIQDATESGIEGVTVSLYDGAGNFISDTETNGAGYYEFINLVPGDYYVIFDHNTVDNTLAPTTQGAGTDTSVDSNADAITGQTALTNLSPGEFDSTIDAGYSPLSGLGDYVWLDANNDGIQDATESGIEGVTVNLYDGSGNFISDTQTNGAGYYEFINLTPGDYYVVFDHNTVDNTLAPTTQGAGTDTSVDSNADAVTGQTAITNLSPGEFDSTIDAGYSPLSGLGDYVWLDANNDGIQDATESGIEGVTVSLYDGSGNFISDTETNGTGYYEFINLTPGDYYVVFDHNTVDNTLAPTTQGAGTDTSVDSNADAITGQTAITNLSPGEFDSTIDAGYSPLSGLGDYVWLDANNDGIQDATESGIEGVTASLYDGSGNFISDTQTNGAGYYEFINLTPGDYYVVFDHNTVDNTLAPTTQGAGTDTSVDSNADVTTGQTAITNLSPGEFDSTIDAGYYPLSGLGDYVWLDANNDGIQDASEAGIEGVTASLYDGSGNFISDTETNGTGYYEFINLTPGDYYVIFDHNTVDNTLAPTTQGAGIDTSVDSNADAITGQTAITNLSPGEFDSTIDAGYYPLSGLGDYVWLDANNDGIQDATESGIEGVTVSLYDGSGNFISDTETNGTGYYEFINLVPGDYYVVFDHNTVDNTLAPTTQGAGTDTSVDSNADAITGQTAITNLSPGEFDSTIDAGYSPLSGLGDYVWLDANNDGIQDATESGIEGVTVSLYDGSGNFISDTETNGTGYYEFINLTPGDYYVIFDHNTVDNTLAPTTQGAGTDTSVDSNADAITGQTAITNLSPGEFDSTIDAGYSPLSGLGDYVWLDANNDGVQDATESGIEGVTVSLYDGSGNFISDTQTNGTGYYEFINLTPGDYYVIFDHNTVDNTLAPTTQGAGTDTSVDSNADAITGQTAITNLSPGEFDSTIDAGYSPLSGLGDYVWLDANNDGIQDATESGIEGVTVSLYDGSGNFISDTETNGAGYYEFINLTPGDYYVVFDHNTVDNTLAPTTHNAGNDSLDSDADPITGQTAVTNLSPGEFDSTIDAGYSPLSGLGDYVWLDANNDGIQDATESGIEGVTVSLYDGSGNFISDTETNGAGYYEFINLTPGDYYVIFDHNTVDNTLAPTTQGAGTDTSVDSNADAITGQTAITNLSPGEFDSTIDAGYSPLSGLGDYVWLDANNDGIQDATESGIEGVTVSLYDGSGNFISDTQTNGAGYYEFINLTPGDYYVIFDHNTVDNTLAPTTQGAGTDTSVDSNADAITGQTAITNLSPGEFDSTIDAGYSPLSGLGDYVWLDANNDGVQDATESGIEGVTVSLYDGSGNFISDTETNGAGYYEFINLVPGDYYVIFDHNTVDNTLAPTTQGAGTDTSVDSNADAITGQTAITNLSPGEFDSTIDAGYSPLSGLGDYVWLDANNDGIQDASESGIEGVTVSLYDGSGNFISDTQTNGAGYYEFINLVPGDYYVIFDHNTVDNTLAPTTQGAGTDTSVDSNADAITGQTVITNLSPGEFDSTIDAGYFVQLSGLGDYVWLDANNDGIQDATEAGIEGVTVSLYDGAGNFISDTQTNGAGYYEFINLVPGDYYVIFDHNSVDTALAPSTQSAGTDTGVDSNADVTTGQTAIINLSSGEFDSTIDAGYYLAISYVDVSGQAFKDCEEDGLYNGGEQLLGNVVVALTGQDINGTTISLTTTTTATGQYLFEDVASGVYTVNFTAAVGTGLGYAAQDVGLNDSIDSDIDTNGNVSISVMTSDIQNLDAGFIDAQGPTIDPLDPFLDNVTSGDTIMVECGLIPILSQNVSVTDNCDSDPQWSFEELVEFADCETEGHLYVMTCGWVATDECGNESSWFVYFKVQDTTAPVIADCADITVACDDLNNIPLVNPDTDDNCSNDVDVTYVDGSINFDICPYTMIRTWTATDECGNTSTKTQNVFITDDVAPLIINVPDNVTVDCNNIPTAPDNVKAVDGCDPMATVDYDETIDNTACPYTITRTWTGADACGNETTAVQVITVTDIEEPVLTGIPSDVQLTCPSAMTGMPIVTATDNCDDDVLVEFSMNSTGTGCAMVIVRTWTATDNCGNTSTGSQTITFNDDEAPVFSGVPANVSLECIDDATDAPVTVTDNCTSDIVPVMTETTTGQGCNLTITRTWTATDECGNSTIVSQVITINDDEAPVISQAPANQSYECMADVLPAATLTATDNCTDNVAVIFNESTAGQGCNLTITRTWTATDECDNTVTVSQVITVNDDEAPVISQAPANQSYECMSDVLPAATLTATDNCTDNVAVIYNESTAGQGCNLTITRTWTATDECDNTVTVSQVITVNDDEAPVISQAPANQSYECMADVLPAATLTATDNCTDNVAVIFNESTAGQGCNLTITRTWTATDECDNTVTVSQVITVNDDEAPVISQAPANQSYECMSDVLPAATLTATDNCTDNVAVIYNESTTGQGCNLTITRTWTATDECDNTVTVSQVITVNDDEAPVISQAPANQSYECMSDVLPAATLTATDNCTDNVAVIYNESTTGQGCNLTITRTWTATDECDNTVTVSQVITVNDNEAPVFTTTPADASVDCIEANNIPTVTAIDNCDIEVNVTMVSVDSPIVDCIYTITRTWTATDDCGNTATTTQVITVIDEENPTLLATPADITVDCENIPAVPVITATDNCGTATVNFAQLDEPTDCNFEIKRIWTATDECGNQNTHTQTITVVDNSAPTVTLTNPIIAGVPNGGTLTIECDMFENLGTDDVTATDSCDDNPAVIFTEGSVIAGNCLADGFTLQLECSWTAMDQCGNESAPYTIFVQIVDTTSPVLNGVPADIVVNVDNGETVPTAATVTASDNCSDLITVIDSEIQANNDCGYTITRTWTATDDCGNTTTESQVIMVSDGGVQVTASTSADNCETGDGTATLSPAANTYVWSDGFSGNTRDGLAAGTYEGTVTTPTGCSDNFTVTIAAECECIVFEAPVVIENETCGESNGSIWIEVSVGNASDYTYNYLPNIGTPMASGNIRTDLPAGDYVIYVNWMGMEDCFEKVEITIENDMTGCTVDPCTQDILNEDAMTVQMSGGSAEPCLDIELSDAQVYDIIVNGTDYTAPLAACGAEQVLYYSYAFVFGMGNSGPYTVSWDYPGGTLETTVQNMNDLTTQMNAADPTGDWVNASTDFIIRGGDSNLSYGTMIVAHQNNGITSTIQTNSTGFMTGTQLTFDDEGTYEVVFVDPITGCTDAITITVEAEMIGGPVVEAQIFTERLIAFGVNCADADALTCIEIPFAEINDYTITNNGEAFTGNLEGCGFVQSKSYNYMAIPGGAMEGPYEINWTINGTPYNGTFVNVFALACLMDEWDTDGNWMVDEVNNEIYGGNEWMSYGALNVTQLVTTSTAILPIATKSIPMATQISVTPGMNEIIVVHNTLNITDTLDVMAACVTTESITNVIYVNQLDEICLPLDELPGVAMSVQNFCEADGSDAADFTIEDGELCISCEGMEVGFDQACMIVCDDYGICDTTYIYVEVREFSGTANDTIQTTINTATTSDVLSNDQLPEIAYDVTIVSQPIYGTVVLNADNTFTYTPTEGYCNEGLEVDYFSYQICTEYGCDMAVVMVEVTCGDMVIYTGFSPNNDGVNDFFRIDGLEKYPNHEITVFNRWGSLVFNTKEYKNDWAGSYLDTDLPTGTYFYVITDGEGETYTGYVQINR